MKLLIKALCRARREFSLVIWTLITLVGLTLASKMETLAIGVLSDSGADFFQIFSIRSEGQREVVTLQHIQEQWDALDPDGHGVTRARVESYVHSLNRDRAGCLDRWIFYIKSRLQLDSHLGRFVALLLVVACIKAIFLFFSRYFSRLLGIKVSRDLREQYFEHLQRLPMQFHQQHTIGGLASRVASDSHQISSSINSMITNYVHAPFTILTTLVFCFAISWQLSLVIFVGFPLVILPIIFLTQKVKKVMRQLQRNQEAFTSLLVDFLAGIQTVKVFAMEAFSIKKYREQNNQMATLEGKTAKYDLLTRPILHTITTFCLAAVVIFGLHILKMRVSELVVFIVLLYQFYEPVKKFAEENANIQKGVVAAERMEEVLELRPKQDKAPKEVQIKAFKRGIEFQSICFRYDKKWVLRDLSFHIKKGETIALVGSTGAGKSTIVQLLPRLYEWQKGDVSIDGTSIQRYTHRSLRELIAFVPQRPFLFRDTISANIAYGRSIPLREVMAAARQAHADEFIEKLPKAYEEMLDETGSNLSGGQQQRLAIARALAKRAPILVLDEATSALDAISEKQIKLAIAELRGQVTQILIAHRLSTIENADRIVYIEKGKVMAQGTRAFLFDFCPPFKKMWDTHFEVS